MKCVLKPAVSPKCDECSCLSMLTQPENYLCLFLSEE